MIKHIIFLLLYLVGYSIFSAEVILVIFILHCLYSFYLDVTKSELSLLTIFFAILALITFCNLLLIGKTGDLTKTIYSYIAPQYIPEAAMIWVAGNTFTFIGYELCKRRSFPRIDVNVKTRQLRTIYLIVFCYVALNLSGINFNLAFLGSGVVNLINQFNMFSILIFAQLWKKENNKKYRNYAIILCVMQTLLALKTSYLREAVVTPIISLTGGYMLGLGKIRYVFSYRMIPFVIIFVLFFQTFQTLGSNRGNFLDALISSGQSNGSADKDDVDPNNKEKGSVLDRLSNIAQITGCVKLTKANGFYGGKASAPLVTALVPRVLWPDKPQIHMGIWFAIEIGAAYVNDEGVANNSINMTNPGELYLDFGWIGVIAGCTIFGCLIAMFWNAAHFNETPYNLTGMMWGGYLLILALKNFGSDLQIVITFFSTYLVFYIIKKIAKT
jgi:hypothetical protein